MLHRMLLLLLLLALPGCAARSLDELSASYERLVAQPAPQPETIRSPPGPPTASRGASFLAIGNAALDAAGSRGTDPTIRIALYRLAAASAHNVLLEEAATGRPVEVAATTRRPGRPAAGTTAASGLVVMRQATTEGGALCATNGLRLPRDCSYLALAESLTLLAVLAGPWAGRQSVETAPPAQVAALAGALRQAPDAEFDEAWQRYQTASDDARAMLARAAGAGAGGTIDPAGYVRMNDIRAYCIVDQRDALVQSVGDRGVAIPGISRSQATAAATNMRSWVTARYGPGAATC